MFWWLKKAHFNGLPRRSLYLKLPYEMGMGKAVLGKLRRCMYGTRDAGAIWEATYTEILKKIGFVQGASSPCCFHHAAWGVPRRARGRLHVPGH